MTPAQRNERLKLIYAAVSGIPALLITPHKWRTKIGEDGFLDRYVSDHELMDSANNILSGTSAHPVAWAAMHPEINEDFHWNAIQDGHYLNPRQLLAQYLGTFTSNMNISLLIDFPDNYWMNLTQQNYKQYFLHQISVMLYKEKAITHERLLQLRKEIYP